MKNKRPSQCKRLLPFLLDGGTITGYEALRKFSIARLPARIEELRKKGYLISSTWEQTMNQFGEPVRVKRYFLEEEE